MRESGPAVLCFAMWCITVFLIVSPIYIVFAWGTDLLAKLGAALVVDSPLDQTVMAFIASAIVTVIGIASLTTLGEE